MSSSGDLSSVTLLVSGLCSLVSVPWFLVSGLWSKGVVFFGRAAFLPVASCQLAGKSKAKFVYCQRSLLVNVVWLLRPARQLRTEDVAADAMMWPLLLMLPLIVFGRAL